MCSQVDVSEVQQVILESTETKIKEMFDDASKHNETLRKAARALQRKHGKARVRSLYMTFWCDDKDLRDQVFEKVAKIFVKEARFICYGAIERTEENKKPHCHVLVMFKQQKTWLTCIKTFRPEFYHVEETISNTAAYSYCRKEDPDDIKEWGEPPNQGERTDLKNILEECDYDIEKIQDNYTNQYMRYGRGFEVICERHKERKDFLNWWNREKNEETNRYVKKEEYNPPVVEWWYGDTATGKTVAMKDRLDELQDAKDIEFSIDRITRFSKVKNEFAIGKIANNTDILILDEFRGSWMPFHELLSLLDGDYVNKKGTQKYIQAKYVLITSSLRPEECYRNLPNNDDIKQLLRRITKITCTGRQSEEEFDGF